MMGVRDFAGGLVVHGAAGAAGLAIVLRVWQEEKRKDSESPQVQPKPNTPWLALSILLLWLGWFGFNPGSTLALNVQSYIVVLITFLAASTGFMFTMFFKYLEIRKMSSIMYAANGILIGLIVITPVAGYVGPGSAVILGILGSIVFILGEKLFQRAKWFTDSVVLFPGHFLGGIFGFIMVAFFRSILTLLLKAALVYLTVYCLEVECKPRINLGYNCLLYQYLSLQFLCYPMSLCG